MSDPLKPDQPKTRRAQPLQPDRPLRGDGVADDADRKQLGVPTQPTAPVAADDPGATARDSEAADAADASARKLEQQLKDAHDNVREGYGR